MKHYIQKDLPVSPRLIVLLIALVALLVIAVVLLAVEQDGTAEEVENWNVYENDTYDFSIIYPTTWIVVEEESGAYPAIHFLKHELPLNDFPFTHFKEVTNVSVYPEGTPVEGIRDMSKRSSLSFDENTVRSRDYLLQSGERFATIATFEAIPTSWSLFGYLWGKVAVDNQTTTCLRSGRQVTGESCDPTRGDTLLREGEVDPTDLSIVKHMMESFRFTADIEAEQRGTTETPEEDRVPVEETPVEEVEEPTTPEPEAPRECRPTGCSSEICADREIASSCQWIETYACYETATCERQPTGECGWTPTEELFMCLQEKSS